MGRERTAGVLHGDTAATTEGRDRKRRRPVLKDLDEDE
jgi:hypothetical protein